MSTDQLFTRLYNKKILPLDAFKNRFLDYLLGAIRDEQANAFRIDGVFDAAVAVTPDVSVNQIDIAAGASFRAVTGTGKTLKFTNGVGSHAFLQNVKVPPDAGIVYHVGLEQNDVDTGVEINPRTGEQEYINFVELPGRLGTPDLVSWDGTTLTIRVNSITESGKDYSGRQIRVWLKSRSDGGIGPKATLESDAIQQLAVAFSGGNNSVATTNTFGQGVSPSLVAADYRILILGPTIRRLGLEDLRATSGVFFLAAVTSVAVGLLIPGGNISTVDQNVIFFSLSDIDDVLRRDSHGDMKIRVTADGSDVDEPQIDVLQSDLVTTAWKVDEDGDMFAKGIIQSEAGLFQSTATAPASLTLDDANIPSVIPLSSSADTALDTNSQNILGAFKEHRRFSDEYARNGVISGLGNTSIVGLSFTIGSGVAWMEGRRREPAGNVVTLTDNATQFVYLDSDQVAKTSTLASVAFATSRLPLFRVVTSAGAVTSSIDIRRNFRRVNSKRQVTVGPQAEFATMEGAVEWVKQARTNGEAIPMEIIIQGSLTMTIAVILDFAVTIRGTGRDASNNLLTGPSGLPAFRVRSSDVCFVDLNVSLSTSVAGSRFAEIDSVAVSRLLVDGCRISGGRDADIISNTGSTSISDSQIINCEFDHGAGTGTGNFLAFQFIVLDVLIANNIFSMSGTTRRHISLSTAGQCVVSGNIMIGGERGIELSTTSASNLIDGNLFNAIDEEAITSTVGTNNNDNVISNNVTNITNVTGSTAAINLTAGARNLVMGNRVHDWRTGQAISVAGSSHSVIGNSCTATSTGAPAGGILGGASTPSLIVALNQIDLKVGAGAGSGATGAEGISLDDSSGSADTLIAGNFIRNGGTAGTPSSGGILSSRRCTLIGNTVDNFRTGSSDGAIITRGEDQIVIGNRVRNFDGGDALVLKQTSGAVQATESIVAGNWLDVLTPGAVSPIAFGAGTPSDNRIWANFSNIVGFIDGSGYASMMNFRRTFDPANQTYTALTQTIFTITPDPPRGKPGTGYAGILPARWTLPAALVGGSIQPQIIFTFSDGTLVTRTNTGGAPLTETRDAVEFSKDGLGIIEIRFAVNSTNAVNQTVDVGQFIMEGEQF